MKKPPMNNFYLKEDLLNSLNSIFSYDDIETQQIEACREWISSTSDLYRLEKDNEPLAHLVTLFLPFDQKNKKIYMGKHIKSGLWLPTGGHVDFQELLIDAVNREAKEELNVKPKFISKDPFFLSFSVNQNPLTRHVDIAFWYLLEGNEKEEYDFCKREFETMKWFDLEKIPSPVDVNMERFIKKISAIITN